MDEACRSDKHLGDGQVKLLTCFNFRYVCGTLRILFATRPYAYVSTLCKDFLSGGLHSVPSVFIFVFLLLFCFQVSVHVSTLTRRSFAAYLVSMYVALFLYISETKGMMLLTYMFLSVR